MPQMNLADVRKGSALRPRANGGFRSLVGFGGPAQTSVAAGATETLTFTISEAGYANKLVLLVDGEASEVEITDIKHNNDSLITGSTPAALFAQDSLHSPAFGHQFRVNDSVSITVKNNDAATVKVLATFTAL